MASRNARIKFFIHTDEGISRIFIRRLSQRFIPCEVLIAERVDMQEDSGEK